MTTVTSYDMDGWLMDLPDLNTGRYFHGCGHYRNDAGEMFFLVAGGGGYYNNDDFEPLTSTEIISAESAWISGFSWSFVGPLPKETAMLAGVSLNNQVFVTGGCDGWVGGCDNKHIYSDILKFDPDTKKWVKTGEMRNARFVHAATVLPR